MVITYCPNCRRIKINLDEIREMSHQFDEDEREDLEDIEEILSQIEDEEEREEIEKAIKLRRRKKVEVLKGFKGEQWVYLSDQERGAIQIILNSKSLLYLVDNFADYLEKCPECLAKEVELKKAKLN